MATAKQTVSPEDIKQAKLDAVLDRMVEIASPHLDMMTDEEEARFLEKLGKIPAVKKSAGTHRIA